MEEWLLGLYESHGASLLSAKGIVELYLQTLEKYVAHYVTYPSDEKKVGLYKERLSTAIKDVYKRQVSDITMKELEFVNRHHEEYKEMRRRAREQGDR